MCLCMVIGVSVSQATPQVQYLWDSVNYTPASQGWHVDSTGASQTNDTVNQALAAESTYGYNWRWNKTGAVTNDPTGWTLTARLEVLSSNTTNWSVLVGVDTGSNLWNIILNKCSWNDESSGVYTMPGQAFLQSVPDIYSVFHTFQIIMAPGETTPKLYVDGLLNADAVIRNGGGTWLGAGNVIFGSGNSEAVSSVLWQEVSFETGVNPIPEPVSISLLGLGALGLLRRKK